MRKLLLILCAAASPLAAQNAPAGFEAARTAPLTAGQWSYATSASGSEARFGTKFQISCDRIARRITLRRTDVLATAGLELTFTTDLGVRTLSANSAVANVDPVLDAIAFSRGRFIVDGGLSRLILPASPEAARSIEDCRN